MESERIHFIYFLRDLISGSDSIKHRQYVKFILDFLDDIGPNDYRKGAILLDENKDKVMDVVLGYFSDKVSIKKANEFLIEEIKNIHKEAVFVAFICSNEKIES